MCLDCFRRRLTPGIGRDAINGDREFFTAVARALQRIEHSNQAVVVACAQGLKLVIMAARTADGQAQEGLPGGAHDVIELIVAIRRRIGGFIIPVTQAKKPGGDFCLQRTVRQFIARQLFEHEAVEGLVVVQRTDDIVTVAPHKRLLSITLVAVAVGVAHHIQPVPGPALAIARAFEQIIHHCVEITAFGIAFLLSHRRRQSGHIQMESAKQSRRRGLSRSVAALLFQLRQHKGINAIAHPGLVFNCRNEGPMHRLKRPVF